MLMIDIANGYSAHFLERIKEIRESFPDKILFAGNVVTAEMTEDLILNGVNIVKVGLGSGSACKTRTQTGVGYPQLSATIECAEAAHRVGGYIMSDGGITCPGDAAKAFAAGADFIMLGGLLSGHDESEFPIVEKDGKKYIEFYGMSSRKAMNKYHGGLASYRSSEGREVLLPYRGAVMNTLMDMLGGIRSSCTYIGAKYLTEMSTFTTFIRVTQQINKIWGD
jgi:GMP reductase